MRQVSILLAVHNGAPFIGDAIQSAIDQTYDNWELIIVSNGSTDETVRICRERGVADARIRVFALPEKGKNAAYNVAYSHATGAYVCFFAADDRLPRESLAERLAVLEGAPANCYSTCRLKTFSADPKYDGILFPRSLTRPNYSGGSLLFSRTLAERVFPLPEAQPNEDTWTALHLRAFGHRRHVAKPLYLYRIHENNSYGYTVDFEHKRREYLNRMRAYQLFYDKYKNEGLSFVDNDVVPFIKGLASARDRNVLRILLVRGLDIGSKLLLIFYCSRLLYGLRHRFFKGFSGGLWSGRRTG